LTQIKVAESHVCDLWRMGDPISFLAAQCGVLWQPGPRAAASVAGLFLLGLAGSAAHCGAMCGPLVVGQVADRLARIPASGMCEAHRLRSGLLLPYHAGRLTTYAALGAAAGAAGLAFVAWMAPLRGVLLLLAAALLLRAAWSRFRAGHAGAWPGRWARGFDRTRPVGAYLFGLIMGLLPCGLLYAALVAACALATPVAGAAGMLAFGLGTVPVLAAIGMAGHLQATRLAVARAAPWVMVGNALLLVVMAVK
jgi:uncharacterized protein